MMIVEHAYVPITHAFRLFPSPHNTRTISVITAVLSQCLATKGVWDVDANNPIAVSDNHVGPAAAAASDANAAGAYEGDREEANWLDGDDSGVLPSTPPGEKESPCMYGIPVY